MDISILPKFMCVHHVCSQGGKKGHWILWNWSNRATMEVMGSKPGSSARAINISSTEASAQPPPFIYFLNVKLDFSQTEHSNLGTKFQV